MDANNKDEWKYDRADLKTNEPIVYVYNFVDPCGSELGRIYIKLWLGGIMRVA